MFSMSRLACEAKGSDESSAPRSKSGGKVQTGVFEAGGTRPVDFAANDHGAFLVYVHISADSTADASFPARHGKPSERSTGLSPACYGGCSQMTFRHANSIAWFLAAAVRAATLERRAERQSFQALPSLLSAAALLSPVPHGPLNGVKSQSERLTAQLRPRPLGSRS